MRVDFSRAVANRCINMLLVAGAIVAILVALTS